MAGGGQVVQEDTPILSQNATPTSSSSTCSSSVSRSLFVSVSLSVGLIIGAVVTSIPLTRSLRSSPVATRSTATSLSEANIVIKGIPKLSWLGYGQVGAANVTADGALLTMVAGKHTAMFVSPDGSSIPPDWSGSSGYVPASALVFEAPSSGVDWQLSAKVTVPKFSYLFDSSCLFGYHGPYDWVNLCFEYSPEKVPEIVSVVTRGVSDDANGAVVEEGNSVYLRLSKFGDVMASHWSLDGKYWTLNRHFALQKPGEAMWIGFDVQAPTAESNTAIYSDIVFRKRTLLDLRDGS